MQLNENNVRQQIQYSLKIFLCFCFSILFQFSLIYPCAEFVVQVITTWLIFGNGGSLNDQSAFVESFTAKKLASLLLLNIESVYGLCLKLTCLI